MTRIFKIKGFARFQRKERINDATLRKVIADADAGHVDADLGSGLIKQRVARTGQGKSGGYRTIIAIRRGERAVFLYGFAKNERSNIDDDELGEFLRIARKYLALTGQQIAALIAENELMEVINDEGH